MYIPTDILLRYEALHRPVRKHETVFREQTFPFFFFQIETGLIKMVSRGEERDFIQGIFTEGESFGEPPLVAEFPYPASAIAVVDTVLWMLPRRQFFRLLEENPKIHFRFTALMCRRIEYKAGVLRQLHQDEPEARILAVIDLLRAKLPPEKYSHDGAFLVPVTRQELADMTGLRVETVIRKVLLLEDQGKIRIADRKILRPYDPPPLS